MLKAPKNHFTNILIAFIKEQPQQIANAPMLLEVYKKAAVDFYGTTTTTHYPYNVEVHHEPKAPISYMHLPMTIYKFMKKNGTKIEVENSKVHHYKFNF
jgi:hypothetical protein